MRTLGAGQGQAQDAEGSSLDRPRPGRVRLGRVRLGRGVGAVLALVTVAACAIGAGHPRRAEASPIHPAAAGSYRVLFDASHAETAGNADWIISTSQPDPLQQNANPTSESSWTGALSSWGVALQRSGRYSLATLPAGGTISYGNSGNAQDLSNYSAFILPEPNTALTASEKTAIMQFVSHGGGLFMISDHKDSDRNNDGVDSPTILNDLMTNNSVDSTDPFGFSIDQLNIGTENPNVIGASAGSDPIIDGPFGTVTGSILRNGTTATLKPADNSAVRGELYRTGFSASGTTGAFVVSSNFGSGRVVFWGDSSPIDDGTGTSGNTLYDGWNDPAGTDAAIALNATEWLAGGTSTGGGGTTPPPSGSELISNGGFESSTSGWTVGGGAAVVSSPAHGGSHALKLGGTNSSTQTLTRSVVLPAGKTIGLSYWTDTTTTETTHPWDTLTVTVRSASGAVLDTAGTVTDAGPTGSWQSATADLSSYAGQTVTLSFSAVNGAKYPTTFTVDDVSVQAS